MKRKNTKATSANSTPAEWWKRPGYEIWVASNDEIGHTFDDAGQSVRVCVSALIDGMEIIVGMLAVVAKSTAAGPVRSSDEAWNIAKQIERNPAALDKYVGQPGIIDNRGMSLHALPPAPELSRRDIVLALASVPSERRKHAPRLAGLRLDGLNLSGLNLSYVDFANTSLRGCDLRKCNITGADFFRADLTNADLRECDCSAVDGQWVKFTQADLTNANLSRVVLHGVTGEGANFSGANLAGAAMVAAQLWDARFNGADLTGANFVESLLDSGSIELAARSTGVKTAGVRWRSKAA